MTLFQRVHYKIQSAHFHSSPESIYLISCQPYPLSVLLIQLDRITRLKDSITCNPACCCRYIQVGKAYFSYLAEMSGYTAYNICGLVNQNLNLYLPHVFPPMSRTLSHSLDQTAGV